MECGCEIDLEGENPTAFSQKDRIARKEHTCYECGRTISPGETYRYESGIWDDQPGAFKTCSDCLSVRREFFCSFAYGELWSAMHEHIVDCHGELSTAKLAKLTPKGRARVCAIWEEYWDEDEMEHPLRFALRLDARLKRSYWYHLKDWVRSRRAELEQITEAYAW